MITLSKEEEQELLAIFRDDDKMNNFLSNLTDKDLKNYLAYINTRVRDFDEKDIESVRDSDEKDIKSVNVYSRNRRSVGTHIAPRLITCTPFFGKLVKALKSVGSRKEKAMLMYYFINELHPFYDGNGRTSRFVYDLLAYKNFDIQYFQDFKHWNNGFKVLFTGFEQSNDFTGTRNAFNYASHFLRNYLVHFKILPDLYSSASTITVRNDLFNNTIINKKSSERIYISDLSIKQGLCVQEATDVLVNFLSNEAACSVIGLSVGVLLSHLNVSESEQAQYIRLSNSLSRTDNGISFWIDSQKGKSVSESIMATWKREDYEKLIYFYDKIQEAMMETMLDIFEKPKSYTINNVSSEPQPVLEKLKSAGSDYYKDAPALINSSFTPDSNTRVYSRVKQLRDFLDMNCPAAVPPVSSINNLWQQASPALLKGISFPLSNPFDAYNRNTGNNRD